MKLVVQVTNSIQSVPGRIWFSIPDSLQMPVTYFIANKARDTNFTSLKNHIIDVIQESRPDISIPISYGSATYTIFKHNGTWQIGTDQDNLIHTTGEMHDVICAFFTDVKSKMYLKL